MNSGVSETLRESQTKQSRGFEIAWHSALVLSFLTLFWALASLSPWTDKSDPLALVGGAVILVLLWVPAKALTIRWRERLPVSPRRLLHDNPQLWIVALYLILAVRDLNVLPTCDHGAYSELSWRLYSISISSWGTV